MHDTIKLLNIKYTKDKQLWLDEKVHLGDIELFGREYRFVPKAYGKRSFSAKDIHAILYALQKVNK